MRTAHFPLPPGTLQNGWIKDGAAVAAAVGEFARRERLQGAEAVTAVPGRAVIIKMLELPITVGAELDTAVEFEAMQIIPENLSNVFLDYQVLGPASGGDSLTVLLTAAKKELVRSYINVLSLAGLVPAVIDVDYLALHNLCGCVTPDSADRVVCVLHAGASVTTLSATGGGGAFLFSSEIETAGEAFTQALAENLGVSSAKAEAAKLRGDAAAGARTMHPLCEELVRSIERELQRFSALTGARGIDRLLACGGAMQLAELRERLLGSFGQRVGRCQLLCSEAFPTVDFDHTWSPEFAVVVGLALRCA